MTARFPSADRALTGLFLALAAAAGALVAAAKLGAGWLTMGDVFVSIAGVAALGAGLAPLAVKVNLLVLLIVVGLLEGGFVLLAHLRTGPALEASVDVEGGGELRQRDAQLGYVPWRNARARARERLDGRLLYDAVYRFDGAGLRITPLDGEPDAGAEQLFFGGSFVFGEGLNDDQTLPYHFGRLLGTRRVRNFAFSGYGPQHMLARLEARITLAAAGAAPRLIYAFIDDHVRRVVPTMRTAWVHHSPYYRVDAHGRLAREATFNEARPWLYALYHEILLRSATLRGLGIDLPPRIGEAEVARTARIIAASRDAFRSASGSDEFIVMIYPVGTEEFGDALARHLAAAGVRVADLRGKVAWTPEYSVHPRFDTHPTALANQVLAGHLAAALGAGPGNAATPSTRPAGTDDTDATLPLPPSIAR